MLGLVGGIVAVWLRLLARDGGSRPEQCLLALRHPIDAPEVVFGRGRVQVGEHLVQCDHLLDDGEKELVHQAEADAREHAEQPQRTYCRGVVGVAARDAPDLRESVPPSTVTSSTHSSSSYNACRE